MLRLLLVLPLILSPSYSWPTGIYTLDWAGFINSFYNPLTEPHTAFDLPINYRAGYTGAAISTGKIVQHCADEQASNERSFTTLP